MSGTTFYVPEATAITPADGECLRDRWWIVHPEKGLAFYATLHGPGRSDAPAPQCNRDERTAWATAAFLHSDHIAKYIPAVYVAHAVQELEQLRTATSIPGATGPDNGYGPTITAEDLEKNPELRERARAAGALFNNADGRARMSALGLIPDPAQVEQFSKQLDALRTSTNDAGGGPEDPK